jgi:hypothetical protein
MFALCIALLASILLTHELVTAADYTVWASVIFSRTGERTPEVLGYIPTTLTSQGAQQAYASGQFFRERYIASSSSGTLNNAPLQGLSANSIDPLELYVMALDEQYCLGSAQAFLQGLYPPFTLNASAASVLDPTSMLSNGSYIDNPLEGYQYAQIHAAGALDPDFPYLGGSLDCPGFNAAAQEYTSTAAFYATESASKGVYQAVGPSLLSNVLDQDAWDYYNAYAIYDYLSYQYAHNVSVKAILDQSGYVDPTTNITYLEKLRWFADEQQYAQLGNLTATSNYTGEGNTWPAGTSGGISTMAGNLLAAKMLAQLQVALQTNGSFYRLSLLFGDFEPLVSFFALAGLP